MHITFLIIHTRFLIIFYNSTRSTCKINNAYAKKFRFSKKDTKKRMGNRAKKKQLEKIDDENVQKPKIQNNTYTFISFCFTIINILLL